MARLRKRRSTNAEGDFYVDSTCIDCGTCRWVAPDSFDASGSQSCVYHQPGSEFQAHRARMALLACPVGAIGSQQKHDFQTSRSAFPDTIEANIYHCLSASPHYCWYSRERQIESMERLAECRFSWVLLGHGQRIHLPEMKMREALHQCIVWMKIRNWRRDAKAAI